MMSVPIARRIAWSIAGVSILLSLIGLVISIRAQVASQGQLPPFSHQFFIPILTLAYAGVGVLVASHHPRNPIGWMFCATGFLSALNMLSAGCALYDQFAAVNGPLPGAALAQWLNLWVWIPNVLLPMTFPLLLLPDGELLSARWRPVAWSAGLGMVGATISIALHPNPQVGVGQAEFNSFGIPGSAAQMNLLMILSAPFLVVGIVGSIASIVVRYRNAVGRERIQLKWVAVAGVIVIVGHVLGGVLWAVWGDDPMMIELNIAITQITVVNIIIAIGIAILRHRLFGMDVILNRTLVFCALTGVVVAGYVVIVGTLSAIFQTRGNLLISIVATGLIAVFFQPLRERLQRAVNRLLYGERDDPYTVLSRLGQQLEATLTPEAVLPIIVHTVAQTLNLPYAALSLKQDGEFKVAVAHGLPPAQPIALPLAYQGEIIGQLLIAPRSPGETFTPAERRLLDDISRQAGMAVHAVKLTTELQALTIALQGSRERLVTTREEERRRLRRDLHDGLGPQLASYTLKLEAARDAIPFNPERSVALLEDLLSKSQTLLTDVRRLVYGLRPPALDELGLVGAVSEFVAQAGTNGTQVRVSVSEYFPPLPAAVEVATYRIVQEALNNVLRHAQAKTCAIALSIHSSGLCIEISDDGTGLPETFRAGVGLNSMRERAEELGGMCVVGTSSQGGTRVTARLPITHS